jgi:RND superfamily putative drug exporter
MELLGRANWYMPGWLNRIVPHLGVEVDAEDPEDGGLSRPADTERPTVGAGVGPGSA